MPLAGTQVPGERLAYAAYKYGNVPLEDLEICLAIAWGESKWYDGAYNFNDASGDKSYGLWQINLIGKLHAPRMRDLKLTREEDLYDLATNARCMGVLRQERIDWGMDQWSAWGAYTNKSYMRHTGLAYMAVKKFKERLEESGDRLHLGEPYDCDSI